VLAGCGSTSTLTIRPTTPATAELVPTPALEAHVYRRVLVLPPDKDVVVDESVEPAIVRDKNTNYYVSKVEKSLLSQGFEVIAPEIVARAAKGATKHSAAERALIMGKETRADAVLMIQSIRVVGGEKFFHIEDLSEVEPGLRAEDDGMPIHRTTGLCLYRLPYYEIRLEGRMIDVRSGDVLWVGSGRETTLDTLTESWTAKLDEDCGVEEQGPFIYGDEFETEGTLDRTVSALVKRMISPMKKAALAGAPLDPPPQEPTPPPVVVEKEEVPPKVEEPPAAKLAVVSSDRAWLRDAPNNRGKRMTQVPRKAKVEIQETMGVWYKVKVQDGTVGWMHESTIIIPD